MPEPPSGLGRFLVSGGDKGGSMEDYELPDLSDWRHVEVWTLEEAAMLWAAIDPMDYYGKRLIELERKIPPKRYKKARLFLRALSEAVCAGSLPFTEAWEWTGYYGDNECAKIDFPDLPSPRYIATNLTRINLSAFLKWVKSKNILSYRQEVMKAKAAIFAPASIPQNKPELLSVMPGFLDRENHCSPEEARIGAEAWDIVVSNGLHERGKTPKQAIEQVLLSPAFAHYKLGKDARGRISTVFNWSKKGGPSKTPSNSPPLLKK